MSQNFVELNRHKTEKLVGPKRQNMCSCSSSISLKHSEPVRHYFWVLIITPNLLSRQSVTCMQIQYSAVTAAGDILWNKHENNLENEFKETLITHLYVNTYRPTSLIVSGIESPWDLPWSLALAGTPTSARTETSNWVSIESEIDKVDRCVNYMLCHDIDFSHQ